MEERLNLRNAHFVRQQSGLVIGEILKTRFKVAQFLPLAARGFAELPIYLKKKTAIVNVKNDDERCFGYALLAALHPVPQNPHRPTWYTHLFRTERLDQLTYPVAPSDIPDIEEKLQLKINVFAFKDDQGLSRYPVYISQKTYAKEIDLLYWEQHYAWIKSFNRFMGDKTKHNGKKFWCKRCLGCFRLPTALEKHQLYCKRGDFCDEIYTMPAAGTKLYFKNIKYQARVPFVVYADFECLTVPTGKTRGDRGHNTFNYQEHEPCAVGYKLITPFEPVQRDFKCKVGPNCVHWFLEEMIELEKVCMKYLFEDQPLRMDAAAWSKFAKAKTCWICKGAFISDKDKVKDHDHLTGLFRGAAHSSCNLKLRKQYKIPIFFHNFRGYDAHIISRGMSHFKGHKLRVIGQGMEKYLTMSFGERLVFKDSMMFLLGKLADHGQNLLTAGSNLFKQTRGQNPGISEERLALLLRKGVYPYDYMDCWEKFEEKQLPPIEAFFNGLTNKGISEAEYGHAQTVWREFAITNMEQYTTLYLKTDVLILADVFESFRNLCLKAPITEIEATTQFTQHPQRRVIEEGNYELDPAHFVSAPHLSWDAMLKTTGCTLDLISDPAMFEMIDSGMRGGICMISQRYARANNKYMGKLYDPKKPSTYIIYLDANNLYGWAMSQILPHSDINWLTEMDWKGIDWATQQEDQQIGYFIECDLTYPEELHESQNDYPMAPERLRIEIETLSEKQVEISRHYDRSRTHDNIKLVPNLMDKKRYCVHYMNLKFYMQHGMKISKIHRVISFQQSRWMNSYITKNTLLRTKATNDFEKDFFKLMINSIYGKTIENQKKRTDIRLLNDRVEAAKLIAKPHLLDVRMFDNEDLIGIELQKVVARIDKPFYVGFSVLELSKLHMYRFHYDVIAVKYGSRAHLLFTDTDSLMYEIETEDIYADMWGQKDLYDFGEYPKSSPFYDPTNHTAIGKFKDETKGEPINEFVGLRPKMYSFQTVKIGTDNDAEPEYHEKHRAKGIERGEAANLRHEQYKTQLDSPTENYLINRRIGAKLHNIYSMEVCFILPTPSPPIYSFAFKQFFIHIQDAHTLFLSPCVLL